MQKSDIYQFIINNDNLEILRAKLNGFNPLKILKLQDYEIRHSNMIAWLCDPNENHNFDDRFLKRFLLKVVLNSENESVATEINDIYQLQNMSLGDVRVYREKDNIDVLLVSNQNRLVILIENKIGSDEHSNQLVRYYEKVQEMYPEFDVIPILLSIDGIAASYNKYFAASYLDVLETLDFLTRNYSERTSERVLDFISYYITILKEKYNMDETIKQLCKDIYVENKEVIDLIYSIGHETDTSQAFVNFNEAFPDVELLYNNATDYWFVVSAFKKAKKMEHGWRAEYPVCFWFSNYYGKLKLTLEIGPFDNPRRRTEFLTLLEEKGIKLRKNAKDAGRKYTRIYNKTVNINDWTDEEELTDCMTKLFKDKKANDICGLVGMVIDEFDWEI
ncbi:MAG TPA: PD-(D/E)XK nuclease family protein [Bacillota bacterium]|nr:PD-(D/E)XK nuclease family protein [Bacillota bacterium]